MTFSLCWPLPLSAVIATGIVIVFMGRELLWTMVDVVVSDGRYRC
jgi:hypothetical protein